MNDRDRFDKFTERARKVLSFSQEEAQRFRHNYIGTEHLLLGLVREEAGVAAQVLADLGVGLQEVRNKVEFIIGRGDRIILGEIGLTPRAKKVIEIAVDEARRLNHHYIGTEHLLLGLVREGDGIGAGVLESLGVNVENVRTQTIQILSQTHITDERGTSPPTYEYQRLVLKRDFRVYSFTQDALQTFQFAQQAAQSFQRDHINPEHVLLGVVQNETCTAAIMLQELGIDQHKTLTAVEKVAEHGSHTITPDAITLTPQTKAYVHLAAHEASKLQHDYLSSEHLLLGLLHDERDIIPALLHELGTDRETIRTKLLAILQANS